MEQKPISMSIAVLLVASLIQTTWASLSISQTSELQSAVNTLSEYLKQEVGADDDSQCGGVLEASTEPSYLSYKFGKPIDHYESCIWTIHAANRSVIKLTNIETYFYYANNIANYISVGFFNKSNYDLLDSFTWITLPYSLIPQAVEIPGPVAFLHFVSTHSSPGIGFQLAFQSEGEEQSSIYNFENYFIDGSAGLFKYPVGGGSYRNNQRTTIVLKARLSLATQNTASPYLSTLFIVDKGIEDSVGCTVDSVNLYGFGSGANAWYKNKTLCGSTPSRSGDIIFKPRNDPVIITFKSDDSGVGEGFVLQWANSDY